MIDAGATGPREAVRIPREWWESASLDEISWLRDHARQPAPGFEVVVEEDIRTGAVVVHRRPVVPVITTAPEAGS